jgi:glycogen debranching enzyme
MLTPVRARQVVDVVQKHLLTDCGLRTLAPGDPQYIGRYSGDQRSRDAAYHQGTVWPWLMGPFITAYLNVNGRAPTTLDQVRRWLEPLREFVFGPGMGNIPEIFDADPPRRAHGCFAQAWSVAELLRICVQELGQGTPKSATAQPAS